MKNYPINLSNLHLHTPREVFAQVKEHLLQQNYKSLSNVSTNSFESDYAVLCAYRGGYNMACAAGCLISDAEYNNKFEQQSWAILVREGLVPPHHSSLILDLQDIHDNTVVKEWSERLNALENALNNGKYGNPDKLPGKLP